MPKSFITLRFTAASEDQYSIAIEGSLVPNPDLIFPPHISETFWSLRSGRGQVTVGSHVYDSAQYLYNALVADYVNGYYTFQINADTVTITAGLDNMVLTLTHDCPFLEVVEEYTQPTVGAAIVIDSTEFQTASSSPCDTVEVLTSTNVLAVEYSIMDSVWILNPNNPFAFNMARGTSLKLIVKDSEGNTNSKTIVGPSSLSVATTGISILNTTSGATVTITNPNTNNLLELQYSLDGNTWREENIFTGILDGNYNIHIKDQLGCQIQTSFAVSIYSPDLSPKVPFSYLSDSMSFRFKHNQVWDNCNVYKTEANTLSCEEAHKIAYGYKMPFQSCKNVTTQWLSNFANLEANMVLENETRIPIPIVKRISFLSVEDKRDAHIYNYGEGKMGIYFTSGDVYDYTSGVVTGTYDLNGLLPNYGAEGNPVYVENIGWLEIVNIDTSIEKQADVLIVDYNYTGEDVVTVVSSIYNQKNYNVYEFDVDLSSLSGETIQVEILQSDPLFGTFNYLSELIEVVEMIENALELIWYNNTDTYVFYSTGLRNTCYIEPSFFGSGNDGEVEVHRTPQTSILISADNYKDRTLLIEEIPTGIMQQLTQAFLHEQLYINKVQYVTKESPESEPIQGTNVHSLTVSLTKAGDVYNSEWGGEGNNSGTAELEGILQTNGFYIKLQ